MKEKTKSHSVSSVRTRKCCPFCGSVGIARRVRLGGFHCGKCKRNFNKVSVKSFKPPVIKKLNSLFRQGVKA